MKLNALKGQSRFIVGPQRPDAPPMLPPLEFGNVLPVELRLWEKSANGTLIAKDLSGYQITLLLGKPNSRPTLGFWQLTTTEGTSTAIPVRATKEEVQTALAHAFGANTVEGGNGSYIVTLAAAGEWDTPTATFEGNTLSNVLIFEEYRGDEDTPAQYRIEVLEVAPARTNPDEWDTGNTTPTNTFTQVSGRLWKLSLDTKIDNGFFTLNVDGAITGFINFTGGAYAIKEALAAAGKAADVAPDNEGGYWVSFQVTVAAASIGGNLVILPYQEGALDLTGSGVRELLDGKQYTSVKLSVVLVKDGKTETISADVMLTMPVNQPATITIDAPAMAGLTFAISDAEDYLQVYINGTHTYDIPLNAPSGSGYMNIYANGHLSYSIPLTAP